MTVSFHIILNNKFVLSTILEHGYRMEQSVQFFVETIFLFVRDVKHNLKNASNGSVRQNLSMVCCPTAMI